MKKILTILTIMLFVTGAFANTIYLLPDTSRNIMTRGISRNNTGSKINAMTEGLKSSDKNTIQLLKEISSLINKNWYLNSEFETDRNSIVQLDREIMDEFSNINDLANGLELELFNPEELPFEALYEYLDIALKDMNNSYQAISQGKSGLKKAKDSFGKVDSAYSRVTVHLAEIIKVVSSAVPYQPQTPTIEEPAPVPQEPEFDYDKFNVFVERKKIKHSEYDIIKRDSMEGKLVLKKSKERLHELSSLDRWLYREALSEKEGYSYAIVKFGENDYAVYWWHVADEIVGVINTIENIFK